MTKDILLWYKCPCGKFHDITWDQYKILLENPSDCYCDIIQTLIQ